MLYRAYRTKSCSNFTVLYGTKSYSDDIGPLSCACPVFRGLLFGDQDVEDSVIKHYHLMRGRLKNGEPRPAPNEGAGLRNAISALSLDEGTGC